jgi:dihydroorotate dehydrogenase
MLYDQLLHRTLLRLEPERAHEVALAGLQSAERVPGSLAYLRWTYAWGARVLQVDAMGLTFPNPVGLAAGFDKNARAVRALAAIGFGAVEVGGVTASPRAGNPRPRIRRQPASRALVNWMGLPNDGAATIAPRLASLRPPPPDRRAADAPAAEPVPAPESNGHRGVGPGRSPFGRLPPLGLNVAGDRVEDCQAVLRECGRWVDYVTLNVSCPNVPAACQLGDPGEVRALLAAARGEPALQRGDRRAPVLLKVSPDLSDAELGALVQLAIQGGAAGIVATNTSSQLAGERGGLSGAPLRARSTGVIRRVRQLAGDQLLIIGVGGILTAEDALEKILAGATLIQVYTGFVYQGPTFPGRLARRLARLLSRRGFGTVADAVGKEGE